MGIRLRGSGHRRSAGKRTPVLSELGPTGTGNDCSRRRPPPAPLTGGGYFRVASQAITFARAAGFERPRKVIAAPGTTPCGLAR